MSFSPPGPSGRPPRTAGRGLLIVISGPSGVGKDTLIKRLLELDPNLRYSISYTTRRPRPGEVDGVNYLFVSRDEFERLIKEGAFLEYATYDGNLYGTPIAQLDAVRAAGHDIVLKIDVQGAELEVLAGANETLRGTNVLIVEVSLVDYNKSAPLIAEVIAAVDRAGFTCADLCEVHRTEGGFVLQLDLLFVRPALFAKYGAAAGVVA